MTTLRDRIKPPRRDRPLRPRNWLAVSAHLRLAGPMKDRRAKRRGDRSWRALLDGGDERR